MKRALSIALILMIVLSLMIITPLTASAGCPFDALTHTNVPMVQVRTR